MTLNALLPLSFGRGVPARAILSVVVVAILLPTLLVAGWLASVSADAERVQIEQNVQQRAHEISTILDREIAGIKGMLTALATSSSLHNGNLKGFHAKATEISQQLGVQIILYDVERNRHILNTNVPFETPLDAYSYPRALVDRVVAANGPFVTGVILGPVIQRHAVGVILPIRPTENAQYLLSAAILASKVANVFDLVQLRAPYIATIVDRNGMIVARSSKHAQFVGEPVPPRRLSREAGASGLLDATNVEGAEFRWFFQKSAVTDWTVLVGAPEEVFGKSFRSVTKLLAGAALALLAIGLTVAYRIGGGLSRAASELGTLVRGLPHQLPPHGMTSNIREANNLLDDLKTASADLRATDWQQRFAIEAAEIGTWSWDIVRHRQIWSRRTRELYRLPANVEPSTSHTFNSIHPADRDLVRETMRKCFAGLDSYEIEFRILNADGESYRWVNGKGRVERDANGAAVFMHGALQDVTERRKIEGERTELRRRLMRAQEEERLRLAHELHDQTGQSLTAALLAVKQIGNSANPQDSLHLLRLREQLEDMGKTVHRIARELRPTAIEDLGLRAALANHLSDWSATYGVASDFHFHCGSDEDAARYLSDEITTAIYRIAQEALTNIIKHAGGVTRVSLVINCCSNLVQMTIEDNGCGFDAAVRLKYNGYSGLGLAGMRERAALVGGSLEIESSSQTGTTIFLRIPIEQRRQVA